MTPKNKEIIKFIKHVLKKIEPINKKINKSKLNFKNKSRLEVDPVTKFDLLIEKKIRETIKKKFPDHRIIGEEIKSKKTKSHFTWYIDPIDGTKALVMGLSNWSNLIGLFNNSKSILSVANFPALNKVYFADKNNTYLKSDGKTKILNLTKKNILNKTIIAMNTISTNKNIKILERIKKKFFLKITGADALNYCLLCEGKIDVVIESGLKKVDFYPLMRMIKNSGGLISDWEGKQNYKHGDVLVSSNKKLHSYFLKSILV